jgi:pimeloyl-ACP methyl ester carboxylesterase
LFPNLLHKLTIGRSCPKSQLSWPGELDLHNRPDTLTQTFEQFPNHHLEVFEGGHAAFLEDPDRFEQSLREFFNGL